MITITQEAEKYLKSRINDNLGLLVEVVKGGCFGVQYKFSYVVQEPEASETIKINDLIIFIKTNSLLFVIGSQLDCYFNNTGMRLIFTNPNAKKTCGCNKSFNI